MKPKRSRISSLTILELQITARSAGLEPVIASMGTALTPKQLRELSRLSRRVWLCFDSDAAGEEATLRGMEAAVAAGFEVKVVALEPGSSGAPLLDDKGAVVGIVVGSAADAEGVYFAVSVQHVRELLPP